MTTNCEIKLPKSAQELLKKAAQTPIDKDPLARIKAIDKAIELIKHKHPAAFLNK